MPYTDKQKQREYQRKWVAKRRQEFFHDKQCIDCGSVNKLELDHVDPKTKIHHAIWSWSQERRENEIDKCVVRCSYCHDLKHGAYIHGTIGMYTHGCRCDECKESKHQEYLRELQGKRPKRILKYKLMGS